jgi:hypothetical protein
MTHEGIALFLKIFKNFFPELMEYYSLVWAPALLILFITLVINTNFLPNCTIALLTIKKRESNSKLDYLILMNMSQPSPRIYSSKLVIKIIILREKYI